MTYAGKPLQITTGHSDYTAYHNLSFVPAGDNTLIHEVGLASHSPLKGVSNHI